MITNFSEQLWTDFDLEIAVFLENLTQWIRFNASKDKPEDRNFHEGQYWSYNSYPQFAKLFPGWSSKTMRTIINRCVKNDLLTIGNFNKKNYDNTNWYTLTEKAWEYFPRIAQKLYRAPSVGSNTAGSDLNTPAQTGRPPAQTGRPIPEEPNHNKNTNNSEFHNSPAVAPKAKKTPSVELRELIDVYREVFPDNPQPHKRVISTSLQKTLAGLVKRWPELDPEGKPLTTESFGRYLTLLRTTAPKFALGEYVTTQGNRKKNSLETFARWNTVVKFLEDAYS